MNLISRKAVMQRLGCGRTSLWRIEKTDPRFPRPVRFGDGLERFDEDEVDKFVEALKANRDAARDEGRAA